VRELVRQILPASATAQDPQNAFRHLAVGGSRSPAVAMPSPLGQQGPNLFPIARRSASDRIAASALPPGAADMLMRHFGRTNYNDISALYLVLQQLLVGWTKI